MIVIVSHLHLQPHTDGKVNDDDSDSDNDNIDGYDSISLQPHKMGSGMMIVFNFVHSVTIFCWGRGGGVMSHEFMQRNIKITSLLYLGLNIHKRGTNTYHSILKLTYSSI